MAVAALAGAAAAAAYVDGRYQIRKDLTALFQQAKAQRTFARSVALRRTSLWYNFESQAQQSPPQDVCIWSRAGTYTWRATYDNSCRYAQLFLSYGVRPGDLVAVCLQNSPEFLFALLGCWAVGTAPACINYNLVGDALIHCLKISGAKLVLVDSDHDCLSRVEELRDRIEHELGMEILVLNANLKEKIATITPERPDDRYRAEVTPSSPMSVFNTRSVKSQVLAQDVLNQDASGTSGLPKACSFPISRTTTMGDFRRGEPGVSAAGSEGVRWYNCMPLYHGTGCVVAVGCLISGATMCIGKKFSTSQFWSDIRESRATAFVYVGETARYLLSAPVSPRDRDHNVKLMYGNGLRPDVWTRFRDRFGIGKICEFFNSTEGLFGLYNPCQGDFLAGAVGHHGLVMRLMLHNVYVPAKIDHDTGDILRNHRTGLVERASYEEGGEMLVRIYEESVFVGYLGNPEASAKKFARDVLKKGDLFYRSGDALRRDSEGRWSFLDRLGDTYRWKGENCSTAEVAECLGRFPGIEEASVYGVQLPAHDGKAGCAAIYITPAERKSFSFERLLAHSRRMLPRFAVPVFLRLTQNKMPIIHNNKQDKAKFRRQGVDTDKIASEDGDRSDVMFWVPPGGNTYLPFGKEEWNSLVCGKAKL